MANKKLINAAAVLAVVLLITTAGLVFASGKSDFSKDEIFVPESETIDGDYLGAAGVVDVAGNINGDVMVAGGMLNFSGKSSGDILAAGGNITVSGSVGGNARVAGGNVFIRGKVARNVTVAGGNVVIEKDCVIDGNLYVAGGSVEIRGDVKGNIKTGGGYVLLAGNIGKDAEIAGDDISIRSDAQIGGNLAYYSDEEISIDKSIVGGEIIKNPLPGDREQKNNFSGFLFSRIFEFFSMLILALVFYKLFSKNAREVFKSLLEKNPWKVLAFGIIAVILIPVISIILIISIVGLPLSFALLVNFAVALFLAKIITFIMIGYLINKRFKECEFTDKFPMMNFILGFLILEVLWLIPVLGWLAVCLLVLWSFGGLTEHIYRKLEIRK